MATVDVEPEENLNFEFHRCSRRTGHLHQPVSAEEVCSQAAQNEARMTLARTLTGFSWSRKLEWALKTKDKGNECYSSGNIHKAIQFYQDALLALDFGTSPAQEEEAFARLQMPIILNLSACTLELKQYAKCIALCKMALGMEPQSLRALYRRGVAHAKLGNTCDAVADFKRVIFYASKSQPQQLQRTLTHSRNTSMEFEEQPPFSESEQTSWTPSVSEEESAICINIELTAEAMHMPNLKSSLRPKYHGEDSMITARNQSLTSLHRQTNTSSCKTQESQRLARKSRDFLRKIFRERDDFKKICQRMFLNNTVASKSSKSAQAQISVLQRDVYTKMRIFVVFVAMWFGRVVFCDCKRRCASSVNNQLS